MDGVILLHGLGRTSRSMLRLQQSLQAASYRVANVGYPSRSMPIEQLSLEAVERGLAQCRQWQVPRIHFVVHSLGGILVRYYLAHHAVPELGRVVMLGPPNQGSEVVDTLRRLPGFRAITGPAGLQLGSGNESLPRSLGPVAYPVGVIAGTSSLNPLFSALLPGVDDGAVSVASTRLEGMTDHVQLRTSHVFIMRSAQVIRQTLAFLQTGRFVHEQAPGARG